MNNGIEYGRTAEFEQRIRQLEDRVARIERNMRLKADIPLGDVLVRQHGESVGKHIAARILGVTRCTIYNMIADGRLCTTCEGSKVSVRSIAAYMEATKKGVANGTGMAD